MEKLFLGRVVESIAGRDKERIFLVVDEDERFVYLANGRQRKIASTKKKSKKHIKVLDASLLEQALRIQKGEFVGNEKLYKSLTKQKNIGG